MNELCLPGIPSRGFVSGQFMPCPLWPTHTPCPPPCEWTTYGLQHRLPGIMVGSPHDWKGNTNSFVFGFSSSHLRGVLQSFIELQACLVPARTSRKARRDVVRVKAHAVLMAASRSQTPCPLLPTGDEGHFHRAPCKVKTTGTCTVHPNPRPAFSFLFFLKFNGEKYRNPTCPAQSVFASEHTCVTTLRPVNSVWPEPLYISSKSKPALPKGGRVPSFSQHRLSSCFQHA